MLRQIWKLIALGMIAISLLSACDYERVLPQFQTNSEQTVGEYVDSLPYAYGVAEPALEAWRAVATARDWNPETIEAWTPFITNVMMGESGFCWNLRGGATMTGNGCEISRQGRGSDSGFGQLIRLHYRPGAWLCNQELLCSAEDIIASPWNSMVALVALVERSGGSPWCYAEAKGYHNCSLVP